MDLTISFSSHGLTKEAFNEKQGGVLVKTTVAKYDITSAGEVFRILKGSDYHEQEELISPTNGYSDFIVTEVIKADPQYHSVDEVFRNCKGNMYRTYYTASSRYIETLQELMKPIRIMIRGYKAVEGKPFAIQIINRILRIEMEHCPRIKDSDVTIREHKVYYRENIYDVSQENFALHYIPKVSIEDELSFILDFSDEKGHFFLTKKYGEPEEEVKLSAIQPYFKFFDVEIAGPCPFFHFGAYYGSCSLNTIVKMFRRYPMLRTFFKTYQENAKHVLSAFNIRNIEDIPYSFTEYTTPAKALGVPNQVLKTIVNLQSNGIYPNIGAFNPLKYAINPQVFENIISEFAKTLVSVGNDDVIRGKQFDQSGGLITKIIQKYGGPKGNKYDFVRLMQYITDEVYTYQGITSPLEAIQLLSDYYNMMDNMEAKITEWFPKSLKLIHDIAARNQSLIIEEVRQRKFMRAVSEPDYQALKYEDKDWVVLAPKTANDLIDEGQRQSHCVGSYINYVSNGEKYILFMRRADDPNTSVITLDVNPNTKVLTQYRGFGNRAPSDEEMEFIKKWAKKKNLKIN